MSTVHTLRVESVVPRPLPEVFAFFADAGNLEAITPPWLSFHILTPRPIEMRVGAIINYQLKIRGVPMRWRSEITAWEPMRRFVDEQRRGPYRMWVHEHTFEAAEGGTLVRDVVRYRVPGGPLVHRWLVRPDLERIFAYRQERMGELLGAAKAAG